MKSEFSTYSTDLVIFSIHYKLLLASLASCPCKYGWETPYDENLYRAVDSQGNTLEFLLSSTRDAEAAKRFFLKALHITTSSTPQARPIQEQAAQPNTAKPAPRVINVDKNAAYPKAFNELKAQESIFQACESRQVKYLNNLIEQDHRFIKRFTKPGMGFFSFETAWRTLQGFEMMNMIRKGQLQGMDKGDVRGQLVLVAKLFGVAV
jgi:transposase, IS6 family